MKYEEALTKTREVIRRQHKALSTEDIYLYWLRRFIDAVRQMPNTLASEQKLERFLTELALKHDVSASTQNQAFNAIVFFYKDVLGQPIKNVDALRATRPEHLRHAPTVKETQALIAEVRDAPGYPNNLVTRLLYGCGLRVSEPLNLRVKDIQFAQGRLFIMGAKGRKDRVVALPCSLAPELKLQLDYARMIWKRDVEMKMPIALPHQLAKKYPEYQFALPWAWLFPARWPCRHPRTGEMVRYRMHEANVQRAIKAARRRIGIMVLPHELRHAYATHTLERGVNIKALQSAMGHVDVNTTMGYCHAEACSVPSPLDARTAGLRV